MKSFTLSLFILLFSIPVFSQVSDTISLNNIISKTETFANRYPQEKVYIHFDKPYYAVGDTIWFKAYLTAGLHLPSSLSKIVYVDVISDRDSLVQSLKLQINNSVAPGNIALTSDKYKQGNYSIRAYTRWMMNFDPDYFFGKIISVGNGDNSVNTHLSFNATQAGSVAKISFKSISGTALANKKITWEIIDGAKELKGKSSTDQNGIFTLNVPKEFSTSKSAYLTSTLDLNDKSVSKVFALKSSTDKIDLQFFPEGGELITDLPSKVAFKAVKEDGLSVDIKGNITDNDGNIVTEFSSQHLGMGTFILVPQNGKTYTARITSPAGYTGIYPLPAIQNSGISLTVTNLPASPTLSVRILSNNNFITNNLNNNLYLIAKVGETVCYAAKMTLQRQAFSATIPKDKFPTGMVQITLLAANGKPLSERLVFVRNQDELTLTAKAEKAISGRRQKVKLSIAAKSNKLPSEANISVAVIDETKVPFDENQETTILSSLLLTSDLKGYIEKPNYYFNKPSDKTNADLDILMLTQGYRRFSYSTIIDDKPPTIYFLPEEGIDITGILRNSTGMPLNKANVRLRIPDKSYSAYAVTNGSGVFRFPNVVLSDSSEVVVTSADYSNRNPMLTVDPIAVQPALTSLKWPDVSVNIDSTMNKYLQNNRRELKTSRVLKEVVIKNKTKPAIPSHNDYPALSGLSSIPDHLITKDRFSNCASLLICIQSMLTGVTFRDENFYVSRDLNMGSSSTPPPMQVFYNGMPVDVNYLNSLSGADIESIEIFLKDQLGTVNRLYNSNGAIVINGKKIEKTKQMKLEDIKALLPKPGEIKLRPQGYSVAREFYSPKYNTAPSAQIIGSDLRTTIYWNPKVKTDKVNGAATFEYFNADGRGTYRVVVEGIDAEGRIGRQVYRYKVE